MNKSGDLGSLPGQLTSITKKTADQFKNEPIETIEAVEAQVGTKPPPQSAATPQDKKGADTSGASDSKDIDPKKATFDVVKELYKQSESKLNIPSDETIEGEVEKNPKKTPEEIQKLLATRQQLLQQQHRTTYFEPTFNPPKRQEEQRPAEEIEKEEKEKKQMEALEFQEEEKKKEELSPTVKQGTHEINPGVSG